MTTYTKQISEGIGIKEKTLRGSRTHSGGEDITTFILSSIWDDIASVSTVWEEFGTRQRR